MIMNKKLILTTIIAMAMTACNTPKKSDFANMDGEWNITEADGSKLTTTTGQAPYIGFNLTEGRVYGYSGCNRIMASIDKKTGKVNFSKMASTMMACPDMETERKVLAALTRVNKAVNSGDGTASLIDADGNEVAKLEKRFEPMPYTELEGNWTIEKTYGQETKKPAEGSKPSLAIDTKTNKLSGHTGCNRLMGNIERGNGNDQALSFGQPATTRMACPDMETERNVVSALAETKSFGRLRNGNVGLFNSNGTIVMELTKATPANGK